MVFMALDWCSMCAEAEQQYYKEEAVEHAELTELLRHAAYLRVSVEEGSSVVANSSSVHCAMSLPTHARLAFQLCPPAAGSACFCSHLRALGVWKQQL